MELLGYRQIREINRGAITTVWQGERIADQKPVLIKVFNPQWQDQPDLLKRFQREAEISAGLKHKNIVEVLEVVEEENRLAIILPFVYGLSLAALLDANRALPFQSVSHITRELLKSLEYAHSSGIVHRDIKPGNVMISQQGEVLLTDFGLAKATAMQAISMHGEVVGTPAYMSPEQARSGEVGPQSDMFSLAATVYEATTGTAPFAGGTIVESIEKLVSYQPDPLHTLNDDVPRWFSEMIVEMLRKNASQRPQSIKELLEHPEWSISESASTRLGEMIQPLMGNSPSAPPAKQKRKIPSFGLPHLLAILLAVTLAFAWQMNSEEPERMMADAVQLEASGGDSVETDIPVSKPVVDNNAAEMIADVAQKSSSGVKSESAASLLQEEADKKVKAVSELANEESRGDTINSAEPEAPKIAGLFLKIKPWGDIYIDGTRRETSPLFRPLDLPEGQYDLEVRNPEYSSFRTAIILTAGKIDTMEVVLESAEGYLDLQVVPWAQIYINEEYQETTPLEKPLTLPVGTHTLRLLNPTYRSWEGTIEILPDKTTLQKVSLTRE